MEESSKLVVTTSQKRTPLLKFPPWNGHNQCPFQNRIIKSLCFQFCHRLATLARIYIFEKSFLIRFIVFFCLKFFSMGTRQHARSFLRDVMPSSFQYRSKRSATSANLDDKDEFAIGEISSDVRCSSPVSENQSHSSRINPLSLNISRSATLGDSNEEKDLSESSSDSRSSSSSTDPSASDSENIREYESDSDSSVTQSALWESSSFEQSRLSATEFCFLLVAIQALHKLPDTAMQAITGLFSAALPKINNCPKTYAAAIKSVQSQTSTCIENVIHVCNAKACTEILEDSLVCSSPTCTNYNKEQRPSGFSIFNIKKQLSRILHTHFVELMRHVTNTTKAAISDIISGTAYEAVSEDPTADGTIAISLVFSSDGVNAFKASDSSLWPVHAIISELPKRLRVSFENVITMGFWTGKKKSKKPKWDIFLENIIEQLEALNDGFIIDISGKLIRVLVRLHASCLDLPAVASIWKAKQWNGKHKGTCLQFCVYST